MSQINYEKGERKPDAGYLSAIAAMGADVLYIVTGQRSVAAVPVANRREYALLDNYRACEEEDKRAIERVALSAARTEPVARTAPKIHVETNKGQVVEGGLTQEGPVIFGGKYKERK